MLDANIMKNQEIANKLTKKKIRFIDVAPAIKKEIAAELGCTVDTVNNALNLTYPTYGEQPDRIRRMARERGGFENTKIRWVRDRRNLERAEIARHITVRNYRHTVRTEVLTVVRMRILTRI